METQLIILEQGNIIVSDEEIKELNWCLDEERNIIFQFKHFNSGVLHSDNHSQFESKCQKIIAGLENQPTIDYSALSDEDCKKIGYVDVENYSKLEFPPNFNVQGDELDYYERMAFIKGFKKAQSLNDKKFSLEDMKTLFAKTLESAPSTESNTRMISDVEYRHFVMGELFNQLIQSLQQSKVFDVEVKMNSDSPFDPRSKTGIFEPGDIDAPMIINNSIKITKVL